MLLLCFSDLSVLVFVCLCWSKNKKYYIPGYIRHTGRPAPSTDKGLVSAIESKSEYTEKEDRLMSGKHRLIECIVCDIFRLVIVKYNCECLESFVGLNSFSSLPRGGVLFIQ